MHSGVAQRPHPQPSPIVLAEFMNQPVASLFGVCICYVESEGAGGSGQLCEDDALYGFPLPELKGVSIFSGILCCTILLKKNTGDRC